jgi:hypothetical protein
MNRRFFVAWAVTFVAWMLGDMVVHGMLLGAEYQALAGTLYRPPADSQRLFPLMIVAHVLLAGAFTWIYAKGVEAREWLPQGLRYGLAVAFLTVVPTYLIYYVVQPTPMALMVRQIAFSVVVTLALGAIVAFLYRNAGRPAV